MALSLLNFVQACLIWMKIDHNLLYLLYGGNIVTASMVIKNYVTSYFSKERVLATGWSKEDPYGEHHLYWSNPPEKV